MVGTEHDEYMTVHMYDEYNSQYLDNLHKF